MYFLRICGIYQNMNIALRKADNADIPELIDIEKSVSGLKIYSPMLTNDEWIVALEIGTVYLIQKDREVVGSISYEKKGNGRIHISGLIVMPNFQGQGFARQALTKILAEIKDAKRIDLDVHPDNLKALKLYQSLGFKEESKKENYYGDGEPRLIMVLEK